MNGLAHGFQYLTENRNDEIHDLLWVLQENTEKLGLPLLTIEDEWGAGQIEFTFAPENGMQAADHALLFRSAIKQVCRRLGYHATFMARPAFPDYFASGWHVHQSLSPVGGGDNAFSDPAGKRRLTEVGMQWIAGPARARGAGLRLHDADHQRLQALPARLVRARPRRVGGREPRRAAARDRRAGVAGLPHREPRRRPGREVPRPEAAGPDPWTFPRQHHHRVAPAGPAHELHPSGEQHPPAVGGLAFDEEHRPLLEGDLLPRRQDLAQLCVVEPFEQEQAAQLLEVHQTVAR